MNGRKVRVRRSMESRAVASRDVKFLGFCLSDINSPVVSSKGEHYVHEKSLKSVVSQAF